MVIEQVLVEVGSGREEVEKKLEAVVNEHVVEVEAMTLVVVGN